MGTKTAISWTDATWNPLRGCTVVSEGCKNCYAMDVAARFSGPGLPYEGLAYKDKAGHAHWTGEIMLVEKHLLDPIHWKSPRRIFVNSMSDLFHPNVPVTFIAQIFKIMAACPQHIFQVLTKRPERMREVVTALYAQGDFADLHGQEVKTPLPNVWLGTSVELQKWANIRIPELLQTPAAVRFLSCEPLLGPLDLLNIGDGSWWDAEGADYYDALQGCSYWSDGEFGISGPRIDWVIVGGESGRYYRPMDPEWARSLRDQCAPNGVAFWYKQDSGLRPGMNATLDGVEYHQFPEVAG